MGKLEAKRARMRGLVEQWRASGEPLSRFAGRHGLTENGFRYWNERFGRKHPRRGPCSTPPVFTPVRVVDDAGAVGSVALEIRLAGGDVIRAGQELPAERLASVIRALRQRC